MRISVPLLPQEELPTVFEEVFAVVAELFKVKQSAVGLVSEF